MYEMPTTCFKAIKSMDTGPNATSHNIANHELYHDRATKTYTNKSTTYKKEKRWSSLYLTASLNEEGVRYRYYTSI